MLASKTKTSLFALIAFMCIFALLWIHREVALAVDEPTPWDHIVDVVAGEGFTVGLRDDGRVAFAGDNFSEDIWKTAEWRDIVKIEVLGEYIVGYKDDGSIRLTSVSGEDHFYGRRWVEEDLSDWNDIEQLVLAEDFCAGLRTDGTVVAIGDGLSEEDFMKIWGWKDIVQIVYSEQFHSFIGLKSDGTVEYTNWADLVENEWGLDEEWKDVSKIQLGIVPDVRIKPYGIKKDGTLLGLYTDVKYSWDGFDGYFMEPEEPEWTSITDLFWTDSCLYALRDDGRVCLYTLNYYLMMYEPGGFSPFEVTTWTNIVQFDCSHPRNYFPAGLRKDGTVVTAASVLNGRDTSTWADVKKIIGCGNLLFGIREDGDVLVTGNPKDEDEERITQAVKNWSDIKDIYVVPNWYSIEQVVALKNDGTVVAEGNNSMGQCDFTYPIPKERESRSENTETRTIKIVHKAKDMRSGTCGPNLIWDLDEDGRLTISGEGNMEGYSLSYEGGTSPWYSLRYQIKSVAITGAATVGAYAFYGCTNLTRVTLSSSVKSIGYSAFMECSSLTDITFPAGLEKIGDSAFRHCISLKELSFPESLKIIEEKAFQACEKLEKVIVAGDTELEYIDQYCDVFESCIGLRSAGPIGSGCDFEFAWTDNVGGFTNWKNLTEVILPDTIIEIPDRAFYGCRNLESIRIPDGVTTIGVGAFARCNKLKDIKLPVGVTLIGDYAFYECSRLKEIHIPEATKKIGKSAFLGCRNLKKVVMPEHLEELLESVFSNCVSLSEIVIPEGVQEIGALSFRGCASLESVTLPKSLKIIEKTAFIDCSNLQRVYYSGHDHSEEMCSFLQFVTDYAEERCGYFDAAEKIIKE